ncbi:hypothetical protein CTATCC11996_15800 [Comamonas testosteroni ATCC 11996]|nr:hypothetical protein CTATCC11996_15800 [Comamonas testosteroni ATCC 11996]
MTQISRQGTTLIQFGKEEEDKDLGAVAQKPQSLIKKKVPLKSAQSYTLNT